jgi:DNA adenine methylase
VCSSDLTGFNGVWQTCQASGGLFATPAGLCNQREGFIDHGLLRQWNRALQGVQLHTGGYQGIDVSAGSWVFCDPPYRDSFTSYGVAFGDDQQRELIAWCRDVANQGSTVWMSNRDAGDGFWEAEAPEARIHRFPIVYTAGRRLRVEGGFEAKPATEVLLIWD